MVSGKELPGAVQKGRFLWAEGVGTRKSLIKRKDYYRQGHLSLGKGGVYQADDLNNVVQEIPEWLI